MSEAVVRSGPEICALGSENTQRDEELIAAAPVSMYSPSEHDWRRT